MRGITSNAPNLRLLQLDGSEQTWEAADFLSIIDPVCESLRVLAIEGAAVPTQDGASVLDGFMDRAVNLRALSIPSAADLGAERFLGRARDLVGFGVQRLDLNSSEHVLRFAGLLSTSAKLKAVAFNISNGKAGKDERIEALESISEYRKFRDFLVFPYRTLREFALV